MGLAYLPFLHSVQMVSPECTGNVIHIRSRLTYICTLGRLLTIPGSSLGTKFRKVRTFCEHSSCDGVHRGDTTGVWVLLESEPVLDSAHSPNALVMRRSASSNLRGGSTFLARFPWICVHFAYICVRNSPRLCPWAARHESAPIIIDL